MLYSKACSVSFYIWEQTHLCKENSLCVLSREINLILTGIPQSSRWKEELTTGFTTEEAESVEKATENVKYKRNDVTDYKVRVWRMWRSKLWICEAKNQTGLLWPSRPWWEALNYCFTWHPFPRSWIHKYLLQSYWNNENIMEMIRGVSLKCYDFCQNIQKNSNLLKTVTSLWHLSILPTIRPFK